MYALRVIMSTIRDIMSRAGTEPFCLDVHALRASKRHAAKGGEQAVADANHVLLFNADEGYQVSHPVDGGDASLSLILSESLLEELTPRSLLNDSGKLGFRRQHFTRSALPGLRWTDVHQE